MNSPQSQSLEQLERILDHALGAGVEQIPQQLRYLLTYCQKNPSAEASRTAYAVPPLTLPHARLQTLIDLADQMTPGQVAALYAEVQRVSEPTIRLDFSSQLLSHLPPAEQNSRAREIWSLLETLHDGVISIRVILRLAALTQSTELITQASGALSSAISLGHKIRNAEARIRSLIALANHAPPEIAHQLYRNVLATIKRSPSETLRSNTLSALSRHIPAQIEAEVIETAFTLTRPTDRARALTAFLQALPDRDDLMRGALETIASIEDEDEKAEALVNLAPNLPKHTGEGEYSDLLTQALSITIGLSKRPLRARALVALSPAMSADLQGETMAALNSLSNERDRAALLAEFAPALSPNMLVACLVIAHTMREQDARVHALTVLAHHVPPQARDQTILDAFAAASNLHNLYERVTALLGIVDILPETLREQAFTNAIEATRLIENENARARALSQLGQYLPQPLIGRALEQAYALGNQEQKLNTLASLLPRLLPDDKKHAVQQMLAIAGHMPFEFKRARAIMALAAHLTPAEVGQAFQVAESLNEPLDRFNATIALAQNMPPEKRTEGIQQAWKLVAHIEEGYDRAGALVAIAPFLPPSAKPTLRKMALDVIRKIDDDYDRASAITLLAALLGDNPYGELTLSPMPDSTTLTVQAIKATFTLPYRDARVALLRQGVALWCQLDEPQRYSLWRDSLRRLKALPLADTLLCLGAMRPIMVALGGNITLEKFGQLLGVSAPRLDRIDKSDRPI